MPEIKTSNDPRARQFVIANKNCKIPIPAVEAKRRGANGKARHREKKAANPIMDKKGRKMANIRDIYMNKQCLSIYHR